ncbi:MAG: hypothetical protein A3H97_02640 [Acidobacteria bacterium RIFCSPLOWO2_02_FULL_65_29]|nr:MAG: hypothetical protein A3H97_02640 [Acidobacteria bacterium RIFCSPLOWO2_02_FULL_65_29]
MEKKPDQRFYSAHDLAYAIEAAVSASSSSAVAAPLEVAVLRRRRWPMWGGLGAAAGSWPH